MRNRNIQLYLSVFSLVKCTFLGVLLKYYSLNVCFLFIISKNRKADKRQWVGCWFFGFVGLSDWLLKMRKAQQQNKKKPTCKRRRIHKSRQHFKFHMCIGFLLPRVPCWPRGETLRASQKKKPERRDMKERVELAASFTLKSNAKSCE